MDITLEQLSKQLFQYLHQMDDEATTPYRKRNHGGLVSYSVHYKEVKTDNKKWTNERSWADRLACLFRENGIDAGTEVAYPESRKSCDIVIQINDKKIWLEVKSAWKYWCDSKTGEKKKEKSYTGYLFGDAYRSHSAAQDIEKLSHLNKQDANYIGLLIVGFDIVNDPIDIEIKQLIEKMKLQEEGWEVYGPDTWPDRNLPICCYNCWFLGKEVQ